MKPPGRPSHPLLFRPFSSLEPLEARIAPATFTVTSIEDAGPGSLRQAILDANAAAGLDSIVFHIGTGFGSKIITVLSPLPNITSPVILDGATQISDSTVPHIWLRGSANLPSDTNGLVISGAAANGSTINGLAIGGFPANGLEIVRSDNNTVTASAFGLSSFELPGNGLSGILLATANNNILGGSGAAGLIVSGNGAKGAVGGIQISLGTGNKILGSKIGTDFTGMTAYGNQHGGIVFQASDVTSATNIDTVIGAPGAGNLISGNVGDGILYQNAAGTKMQANIIGLAKDGSKSLPNSGSGIRGASATTNSSANQIGGTGAGEGNVISGNTGGGINFSGLLVTGQPSSQGTIILGNLIGTDASGNVRLPTKGSAGTGNGIFGIQAKNANNVVIGGSMPGGRNVISGNGTVTVLAGTLYGGLILSNCTNSTVAGNYVGTDGTGAIAAGNLNDGVRIVGGTHILIGGTATGAGNIISANGTGGTGAGVYRNGIFVSGRVTIEAAMTIAGNYIGTDVTGTKALGNALDGIGLSDLANNVASGVVIGGTAAGARNVISGNAIGIEVGSNEAGSHTTISSTQIGNNFIGTDVTGTLALGNGKGISIHSTGQNTLVGIILIGNGVAARNVISGNTGVGIEARGAGSQTISNNYIGVDVTGSAVLGNGGAGVLLGDTSALGSYSVTSNVISGNGVLTKDPGVVANGKSMELSGNIIGLNAAKTQALGNAGGGISVGKAGIVTIGKTNFPNYIGGNGGDGITITSAAFVSVNVAQNYLGGTWVEGGLQRQFSNAGNGVTIQPSKVLKVSIQGAYILGSGGAGIAADNVPGLDIRNNTICGSGGFGISLANGQAALVRGNSIGYQASAGAPTSNLLGGILLTNATAIIGDDVKVAGGGNSIAGNGGPGIKIQDSPAGTTIRGNFIGRTWTESSTLTENAGPGIWVVNTPGVTIGGSTLDIPNPGANDITGNQGGGVRLENADAATIRGNFIGIISGLGAPIDNGGPGISIRESNNVLIGGSDRGMGNVISHNHGDGVEITDSSALIIRGNLIGTDRSGDGAAGNLGHGIAILVTKAMSSGITIGGSGPNEGNVISNNGGDGIWIDQSFPVQTTPPAPIPPLTNVQIGGNFIGTDARGLMAMGNAGNGITLLDAANGVQVGVFGDADAQVAAPNVISANRGAGIYAEGGGHLLVGNYIGLDATGASALGNAKVGIDLQGSAWFNGFRVLNNVISANGFGGPELAPGLSLHGGSMNAAGNIIGLNATQTAALGNAGAGIAITSARFARVAAITPEHTDINIIAGNGGDGIVLSGTSEFRTEIDGNRIGLAADGTAFPNQGDGVRVVSNDNFTAPLVIHNLIGHNSGSGVFVAADGNASIQSNEIFANGAAGVTLQSAGLHANGVSGNQIHDNLGAGLSFAGTGFADIEDNGIRANGSHGISIESSLRSYVRIQTNTISGNHGAGVGISPSGYATVRQNAIFANDGLAIDLNNDGPTPNDPLDADGGANDLQNSLTFRSAYLRYGVTLLRGSYAGATNGQVHIELFSYTFDAEGHETGSTFLTSSDLITDASGHGTFSVDLTEFPAGTQIGATVTDYSLTNSGTSEYSYVTTALPANVFAVGTERGAIGTAGLVTSDDTGAHTLLSVQPYGAKFKAGVNVAHADVDHDGLDDLITAPAAGIQPVRVFSGFDGTPLTSWNAAPARFTGGVTVAAGDVDGDGVAEIITALGQGGAPRVTVHEAISGLAKNSFLAFAAASRTGVNLTVGDLDGDGRAEVVASTATSRAAVHVFYGNGTSAGPIIRPFSTTFSAGAHVAIYHPVAGADALLAIGSGAGVKSTVAFYKADGSVGLPAIRVADPRANAEVRLATMPSADGSFDYLVTGTDASSLLEIRSATTATPVSFRPFDLPARVGLTLG